MPLDKCVNVRLTASEEPENQIDPLAVDPGGAPGRKKNAVSVPVISNTQSPSQGEPLLSKTKSLIVTESVNGCATAVAGLSRSNDAIAKMTFIATPHLKSNIRKFLTVEVT